MSLNTSYNKLRRADKDFFAIWDQIRTQWRDDNARQFEETYITLLQHELKDVKTAFEHMGPILQQLRNECS
jgi:hypothetical protein